MLSFFAITDFGIYVMWIRCANTAERIEILLRDLRNVVLDWSPNSTMDSMQPSPNYFSHLLHFNEIV